MNSMEVGADSTSEVLPQIADHVLIRRIGKGSYGAVWLAKSIIGGFHAVKVISRKELPDERSYQREFEGICKFNPISRSHPGLVAILHVGQNEQAGNYYYVMELADGAGTGQTIMPDTYLPRTLKEELANHPRLPLNAKLQVALSLTSALGYIHEHGLIHRDIKPSNIIFVNDVPKIADIGLITSAGEDVSNRGTLYYMPPEGPGKPTADIFSLGKVFYELFMGMHPKDFPELPGAAEEFTSVPELLRINNLILKACHHDPRQRFQSTKELYRALQAVAGTAQERHTDIGTTEQPNSPSSKAADPLSRPATVDTRKTTGNSGGRSAASGEQRPNARLSRRAALFMGVPVAIGGAFFLGKYPTSRKLDEARAQLNEAKDQLNEAKDQLNEDPKEKQHKWQVLYDLLDDKLVCFMGYVGTVSPNTKFLIYSRGTDKNWVKPGFRDQWVTEIEARFPALKGRINTMEIEIPSGEKHASFRHPETADEMKKRIKLILSLPDRDPISPPSELPVLVLMDTTAARGIYDEENKRKGTSNAIELHNQLRGLPLRIETVPISIDPEKRDYWQSEQRVLAYKPSLVIFHRSAFFHPVNAELGLGYPPF